MEVAADRSSAILHIHYKRQVCCGLSSQKLLLTAEEIKACDGLGRRDVRLLAIVGAKVVD